MITILIAIGAFASGALFGIMIMAICASKKKDDNHYWWEDV